MKRLAILTICLLGGFATQAQAADAPSLEFRVAKLESDMYGAYENTSYLSEHVRALQARDAELQAQLDRLRVRLVRLERAKNR